MTGDIAWADDPAMLWPYYPELLATPVPRYTSYPTAAEFSNAVGRNEYDAALATVSGDVSLYVHIPFCEKICWYCGCNTGAANRTQRLTSYLEALHREIALVAARLPAGTRVTRIAFGGGSPNALAAADFMELFHALRTNFRFADPVVSVELDPRTLKAEWDPVIADIGATHASMGVQTFSARLQQAIGRVQPLCLIDRGTRMLRAAGVTSLNYDLMYGLPGQTQADLAETLELAVSFAPERIALFGYAHVPKLIPRQRQIDATNLPDQAERFAMAELGHRFLTAAGYQAVGFDHFASPGDSLASAATAGTLHRNFQGFTDDASPVLIGLGASAISSFPELLVQNEKNAGRYRMLLSQDALPAAGGVVRTADDRATGAVVERLLCLGRSPVDPRLLERAIGGLRPFLLARLCELDGGELVIAPRGLPYARSIVAQFDPYRQHSPRRFSSAV